MEGASPTATIPSPPVASVYDLPSVGAPTRTHGPICGQTGAMGTSSSVDFRLMVHLVSEAFVGTVAILNPMCTATHVAGLATAPCVGVAKIDIHGAKPMLRCGRRSWHHSSRPMYHSVCGVVPELDGAILTREQSGHIKSATLAVI